MLDLCCLTDLSAVNIAKISAYAVVGLYKNIYNSKKDIHVSIVISKYIKHYVDAETIIKL